MKYTKPAFTLEQQLNQLVRRGMIVTDSDRALYYLQHISYYRLRAFWLPNEVPAPSGEHAYKPNTRFDDILDLYIFDRKLRLLAMDAIERMEVSFRTRWSYILATQYGSHAYQDVALFRDSILHGKCLNNLKSELGRSHETFVLHYLKTYTDPAMPPLWMISEIMSFGQLSLWFQNLAKGKDRADIAKPYGIDEQILESFGHHLTYVRNVCAHHSRLWNREMTIGMKLPRRPVELNSSFNSARPKRIYNTLVMLVYLLDKVSPQSTWRSNLLDLIAAHPTVDLAAMGFPVDWKQRKIWL